MTPHLSLVLPAFNEEAAISSALSAIRAYLDEQSYAYQVIVAADGTDATPDVVKSIATEWPSLELTFERGRHGKGYGLRQGMRMAQGEIVGFMDADYKVPIGEMAKLLPWFNDGFDLVIGSRALSDSLIERHQPWFRQIGSRAFGLLMHALVGLNQIQDTQCGFKFFTRQAAQDIFALTRIDGYMCDVEILWLAEKLGYPLRRPGSSGVMTVTPVCSSWLGISETHVIYCGFALGDIPTLGPYAQVLRDL